MRSQFDIFINTKYPVPSIGEATTMKRRDNSNSYKNFRGNARKWRKYRHNRE